MRGRLAAALLAALVLCSLAPAAAGAVPARFWGVVPQEHPTPEQLQRLKRGGADSVRLPVFWALVQPTRNGAWDWSSSDAQVGDAARAGLEVLAFLHGAPRWAVPEGPVPGTGAAAYASRRLPAAGASAGAWRRFVRQAVLRYGAQGSFWAENPELPRRPVRSWQIWNEPNFKYFVTRPRPGEYGRLVAISSGAIRSADPGARVVLGGLFASPAEANRRFRPPRAYFATDFLARMLAGRPWLTRRFDAVALHPYSGNFRQLAPQIRAVRAVLDENRAGRHQIWITELGWSSRPPRAGNSFAKGWRGQARELRGAFQVLRSNQRAWSLGRVFWFSVGDLEGSCNFCDGSGLFRDGFRPKPAWHAFVALTGGRAR